MDIRNYEQPTEKEINKYIKMLDRMSMKGTILVSTGEVLEGVEDDKDKEVEG